MNPVDRGRELKSWKSTRSRWEAGYDENGYDFLRIPGGSREGAEILEIELGALGSRIR